MTRNEPAPEGIRPEPDATNVPPTVTDTALFDVSPGGRVVPAFETPQQARDAGIALVEAASDDQGRKVVDQAIRVFAARGLPFSANDLRHLLPAERSGLLGARFLAAARRGEIHRCGYILASHVPATAGRSRCGPLARLGGVMTVAEPYANMLAERAVVGSALLGEPAGLAVIDPEADLTDPRLRAVAVAVDLLVEESVPVDAVSVLGRMQALPEFPWARSAEVGVFLAELASVECCPVPAQALWHAQTVRAATARRRLMATGQRLQDWAAAELDPQVMVDRITAELHDLTAAVERITPAAARVAGAAVAR